MSIFKITKKTTHINFKLTIKYLKIDIAKIIKKINYIIKFQDNKCFKFKKRIYKNKQFKNDYELYLYLDLSLRQVLKNLNIIKFMAQRSKSEIDCIYITHHNFFIVKYK